MCKSFCRMTRLMWATGVCLLLNAAAAAAGGQGDSQVKFAATAEKIYMNGRQVMTVKMHVNKGWHAYANPVKFEDFESNRTDISVQGARKLQEVFIDYPAGELHKDGKDLYQIYQGDVDIKVNVKRAPGDTGPLEVTVKFVTCNHKLCLPQETAKLQVK